MIALWYQIPLGIGMAASIRVGNLLGARDLDGARRASAVSLAADAALMMISAALFVVFRWELPTLFTSDAQVVALAALILPIAGAFQVFDGVQAVAGGILRGAGRTQAPAAANLFGYYALALPLAAWIGAADRAGIAGIWWSLLVALVFVSGVLLFFVRRASRMPLAQLRIAAH